MVTRLELSWDAVETACRVLSVAPAIAATSWVGVLAVGHGGVVPAELVAKRLHLPVHEPAIIIESYDSATNEKIGEPRVLGPAPKLPVSGARWLVIDDLVDSGATMRLISRLYPSAHRAVLYAKPNGRSSVHSLAYSVAQGTWLSFPWECSL